MAIVVEEGGNKTNMFRVLIWAGILVVVIVAIYYIFFVNPPLVDVVIPPNFVNIKPLGESALDANQTINGPAMSSLKQYVTVPEPDPSKAGRPNPFVPF
ncbi:MAG: hypothetical protein A2945_04125 [Candidatus Liptonbacteria bacterium RIFCSPLOWO2_01_FULL_52_25]|uniref:Uncharacterized protein n=1 Tax=Candidatus Liptonbacteria bacterium RIFCSPLOWO2_01_FULL_52_25 TaxID=1798650 RepID=A0A1G2CC78_9BACT|nr:MAG: hypothetical protein A2945_04125 [Candidatus Liptonbacteria bacterium RIFCSPLOWO2_01_FULL_52_25]